MHVSDMFKRVKLAYFVYVMAMPLLLYAYGFEFVFYLLLFSVDAYMLKNIDVVELVKISLGEEYKKESNQVMFYECMIIVCLVIIAFKSLELAGILLLNDIILDVVSFFLHMNAKKSK